MHDLAVSDVNSHMAAVADDIACLSVAQAALYLTAHASVSGRGVGKGYAEILIYAHDKSGTVSAVRQARSAVSVRVSHKLKREFRNRASGGGYLRMGSFRSGRLHGFGLGFGLCGYALLRRVLLRLAIRRSAFCCFLCGLS